MNQSKKAKREFDRRRKVVVGCLWKLERRFGVDLARAAMRRHLESVREEDKRIREIQRLQDELESLRKKRK